MVEAGLEDRRRPAVVLGGAEDDDRVGRRPVVAVADVPDPVGRPADDEDARRRSPASGRGRTRRADHAAGRRVGRHVAGTAGSAAVALLVLLARAAPARIVAADPGAGRGEAGLRLAGRHAPPVAARLEPGARPSDRAAGRRRRPARPASGRPAGRRRRTSRSSRSRRGRARPAPRAARPPSGARAPAARLCSRADSPGGGVRVTVTRKIVVATWWRMRSRSSPYSWNASRRNSLSGSCWA